MSKLIALRLPNEIYRRIVELVEAGKFKNFSEVVREALRRFLESEVS